MQQNYAKYAVFDGQNKIAKIEVIEISIRIDKKQLQCFKWYIAQYKFITYNT